MGGLSVSIGATIKTVPRSVSLSSVNRCQMSDRKLYVGACEALNEVFRKLRHGWCAQRPGRH